MDSTMGKELPRIYSNTVTEYNSRALTSDGIITGKEFRRLKRKERRNK